ncbi:MAG: pseudaminic acid biosynthesis-associated methylase [Thiotrichales bacterium]|jgi:spore coat polysaccharide biosynthesis protein SpsF|nr:pseudaminic acid biosynthesis-associated methylase [Thiotrichales bacterium]
MTTTYKTEQEAFWAGQFGNDYIARNQSEQLLAGNLAFFSKVIAKTVKVGSVLEMGANVGMNLRALSPLLPTASLHAIEINEQAANVLRSLPFVSSVMNGSMLDYVVKEQFDFVFTKGVLIHLAPEMLPMVYDKMVEASARYVMVAEYYNPSPMEIPYRGHSNKMFKRDFAGELMARHPNMQLIDYGFLYRNDPNWPQDDITWFLMEKH